MNKIYAALWAEGLKTRRSNVFWLILLFFMFMPLMLVLLMFVQKHPDIGEKLGMIGTKATLMRFGNPDWPNFLNLINQTMAAIGLIGFGFVACWIFGREHADHTMKDILALPLSRFYIVLSKFIIVFFWCLILALVLFIFAMAGGWAIALSGWSFHIVLIKTCKFLFTTLLTFLLCTPVAFFAGYGRGYLLPMGFVILTLILANFIGILGLGPYFPWAVPGIYSIGPGAEGMQLNIFSYIIYLLTCIIGLWSTFTWWRYADQK